MEVLTSLICLGRLCYTTKVLYRLYFCTILFCNFLQIKTHFYCSLYFCASSPARTMTGPGWKAVPFTTTQPTGWSVALSINSPQPITTQLGKNLQSCSSFIHSTNTWGERHCARHCPRHQGSSIGQKNKQNSAQPCGVDILFEGETDNFQKSKNM